MIKHYFSVQSIFAYLGLSKINGLARSQGLYVQHIPVDFDLLMADSASSPRDVVDLSTENEARAEEALRWAIKNDVALEPALLSTRLGAPHFCHLILVAADLLNLDVGNLLERFLIAQWNSGCDLADAQSVIAVMGFDASLRDQLLEFASSEEVRMAYISNSREAMLDGVRQSPTYMLDTDKYAGLASLQLLAKTCEQPE